MCEPPGSHLWFPDAPLLRDNPSRFLSLPLTLALKGACLSCLIITWLSSPAPLQGHLFLGRWFSDFIYYIQVLTRPDKNRSLGLPIPGFSPSGGLGLSPRMYVYKLPGDADAEGWGTHCENLRSLSSSGKGLLPAAKPFSTPATLLAAHSSRG